MRRDELRAKFSQTVGVDKAEAIIAEAEASLGLDRSETYSSDEVRDLCEEIQYAYDGYVSDVANEIRVHEQAEQRFRTLLENIPDPAVVVVFESDQPIIRTANEAFETTFGADAQATVGRPLAAVIDPEQPTGLAESWVRSDQHGERELRCVTADGEERTFLVRSALAHRAGGAVEGYGIFTDITDRERRERKLHNQNERLEQFASVVSHDLRNPLNVASGRLSLALDSIDDESVRDQLEAVAAAHEQMESLIDDLLTLARQGRTVGETEAVDLAAVCEEAWSAVDTGDATLRCDLDGQTVGADPNRLSELLQNLFRNAVEHGSTSPPSPSAHEDAVEHGSTSPPSSSTREDAGEHGGPGVTVRVAQLDGKRGFAVEDDGPGIPEADREVVFESGFTTAEGGTGFGLAIVHSIAEAHGWTVTLTTGTEGGARFEFSDVPPA